MRPQEASRARLKAHRAHKKRVANMSSLRFTELDPDELTEGEKRAIRRRGGFYRQVAMLVIREVEREKRQRAISTANLCASMAKHRRITERSEKIISVTAKHFGFSPKIMLGQSQKRRVAFARQVSMYLMFNMTRLKSLQIAQKNGRSDHTTALHAKNRIANMVEADPEFRAVVDLLMRQVEA